MVLELLPVKISEFFDGAGVAAGKFLKSVLRGPLTCSRMLTVENFFQMMAQLMCSVNHI